MVHFLFKWLMIGTMMVQQPEAANHPIFVSVTEIEHNATDKTLEISCKIFTDDFEKTLRQAYKTHVDLLDAKYKSAMNKLVSDYVQKHLQLNVDGKAVALQFIGYQREEEGIISFYQVNSVPTVKKIDITNNILFEYKKEQMGIVHVNVNGKRQSTKLLNPEEKYSFEF